MIHDNKDFTGNNRIQPKYMGQYWNHFYSIPLFSTICPRTGMAMAQPGTATGPPSGHPARKNMVIFFMMR